MTDYLLFNVTNQTLFPLQIASPATYGSDWQKPTPVSETNIEPGASAMLGVISEPGKLDSAHYDWLYLNWLLFNPVTSSSPRRSCRLSAKPAPTQTHFIRGSISGA
jgi:hypothetical protein